MTDNTNEYPVSLQVLEPALAAILVSVRMTGYTLKAGYPERVPKKPVCTGLQVSSLSK